MGHLFIYFRTILVMLLHCLQPQDYSWKRKPLKSILFSIKQSCLLEHQRKRTKKHIRNEIMQPFPILHKFCNAVFSPSFHHGLFVPLRFLQNAIFSLPLFFVLHARPLWTRGFKAWRQQAFSPQQTARATTGVKPPQSDLCQTRGGVGGDWCRI